LRNKELEGPLGPFFPFWARRVEQEEVRLGRLRAGSPFRFPLATATGNCGRDNRASVGRLGTFLVSIPRFLSQGCPSQERAEDCGKLLPQRMRSSDSFSRRTQTKSRRFSFRASTCASPDTERRLRELRRLRWRNLPPHGVQSRSRRCSATASACAGSGRRRRLRRCSKDRW